VIMANCKGDALTASSRDLLPRAFTGKWLE